LSYRRLADDVDEQLKNKLDRFLYEWAFSQVCQCRIAVLNPTSVSAMVDYFSWGGANVVQCSLPVPVVTAVCICDKQRGVIHTRAQSVSRPSDCREVRIAQIASSAACDGRILLCVSVYTRLDLVAFQRLHIAGLDRHTVGELHAVVICCRVSHSPVVLVISTLETRSQSASSLSRR